MNQETPPQPEFNKQMERIVSLTGARTQLDLAEFLGIRQAFVSDARRRAKIPADWLITLARKLNANPEWVLGGKGRRFLELGKSGGATGGRLENPEEEPSGGLPSSPRGREREAFTEN